MNELNEQLDELQASIERRFNADMRDPEIIALSKQLQEDIQFLEVLASLAKGHHRMHEVDADCLLAVADRLKSVIIPVPIADDAPPTS